MENEEKVNNKERAWWLPAIIMFFRISVWVALPIVAALFIGKFLDNRYGTDPWIFISLTIVAFIISISAIAKISLTYINKIKEESKNKTEETHTNLS